jgi:hypothetical protein
VVHELSCGIVFGAKMLSWTRDKEDGRQYLSEVGCGHEHRAPGRARLGSGQSRPKHVNDMPPPSALVARVSLREAPEQETVQTHLLLPVG